jgi:hypothetical protein
MPEGALGLCFFIMFVLTCRFHSNDHRDEHVLAASTQQAGEGRVTLSSVSVCHSPEKLLSNLFNSYF